VSENVVTIGTFDGVHLGHRAILDRVDSEANRLNARRLAYVFELPPRMTLEANRTPRLLLPLDVRLKLLRRFVDRVELARFGEVRALSPDAFASDIIAGELDARSVVVGAGFRFGRDRSGDLAILIAAGEAFGFDVQAVEALRIDGEPVSSTRIRSLLSAGDVSEATAMLGRPPILVGRGVRREDVERQIEYPTFGLELNSDVLVPADGVYAVRAFVGTEAIDGLLHVGAGATLAGNQNRCEVQLLSSPDVDLDGCALEAHIVGRLRNSCAAASLDARKEQIHRDAAQAADVLANLPNCEGPIGG
jgi:riboflavin kinase/FMN adenylyltransferase